MTGPLIICNDDTIWPCVIMSTRYGGTYEGGRWVAIPCHDDAIHPGVQGDDFDCSSWFENPTTAHGNPLTIGVGDTPQAAYDNLVANFAAARQAAQPARGEG